MSKKYSKEDVLNAKEMLLPYKNRPLLGIVNHVSQSGMQRRIEFYTTDKEGNIHRIGYYIARVAGYDYSIDKGGIKVNGCGMDMVFSVISHFNYAMAQLITGKTLQELLKTGEVGERIYDSYFFDANRINS